MRRGVAVAVGAAALALPTTGSAHLVFAPPFVEAGEETPVVLEVPGERPPHATIEVGVTAPPGVVIVSASGPPTWRATIEGGTATWRGGRVENRATTGFPLRILAKVRAGTYTFQARQRYDDGAVVTWKVDLNVLPASGPVAPEQHLWAAIVATLVGIGVIAGSLLGLRRLRRGTLQER